MTRTKEATKDREKTELLPPGKPNLFSAPVSENPPHYGPTPGSAQAHELFPVGALCFPIVNEGGKIAWMSSGMQSHQLDMAAALALKECFDVFPYPTVPEMNALALRYRLHPGQVDVWFMGQRLCYGISWNAESISGVRSKVCVSEPVDGGGREKKMTGENKESSSPRVNKVDVKDQPPPDCSSQMTLQPRPVPLKRHKIGVRNATSNPLWQSFCKNPKPSDEELLCLQRETGLKLKCIRKWFSNRRFMRTCQKRRRSHHRLQGQKSAEDMKMEAAANGETRLSVRGHRRAKATDQCEEERSELACDERHTVTNNSRRPDPRLPVSLSLTSPPLKKMTPGQLLLLRQTFMTIQWPNIKEKVELQRVTGLSRRTITQWFGDMRYNIKNGTARWVPPGEEERILAGVWQIPKRVC